jgi:hypothetical protein
MAEVRKLKDPVFGELAWDLLEGAWAAGVEVDYFQDFGKKLPSLAEDADEEDADGAADGGGGDDDDAVMKALSTSGGFLDLLMQTDEIKQGLEQAPAEQRAMFQQMFSSTRELVRASDNPVVDYDKLLREGKFILYVVPPEDQKPPNAAQRKAWAGLLKGGGVVFDEVMNRALETYRRQRPVRVRWWKAYDEKTPPKHLPDVKTTAALAKVVRPTEFRVFPGGEVGIEFDGSWDRIEALGVVLRGGEIVAFGPAKVVDEYRGKDGAGRRIDHPVFGPLRLHVSDEWVGIVHFEAFRDFYEIAPLRRKRRLQRSKRPGSLAGADLLPWTPSWDFIEGEFELTVYTEDGREPSQAQADAFLAVKAGEKKVAEELLAAAFKYYRQYYAGDDEDAKQVKSPDDLRERVMLQSVNVYPPRQGKPAAVVLNLACAFDEEHGMSVLWRGGKVEQVEQMAQVDV